MASTTPFLTAVSSRRSVYTINKTLPIQPSQITDIVKHAITYAPSPFNVRSCRCIILFNADHDNLWDLAYEDTKKNQFAALSILGPKIKGYKGGAGTVLFFDDQKAYEALTPRFAALSKQFPDWEEHSSGMHQFIVWTALEAEGLGCNLQHYQHALTSYVREKYGVPEEWRLKCQLVFGGREERAELPEKERVGLEGAVKEFGI